MKKSFLLLSGTIALATMVNVNAMEQRLSKVQACDQINYLLGDPDNEQKDWQGVFRIIDATMDNTIVNDCRLSNGDSLLYCAVDELNLFAVKTLLEKYHANPNIGRGIDKRAPLTIACIYACYDGNTGIVELLLMHGADPFLPNGINNRPHRNEVIKLINSYRKTANKR